MKRKSLWILSLILILVIFSNSAASGEVSSGLSLKIAMPLHRWLSSSGAVLSLDQVHFLVRKGAHFSEYALLGLILMAAFRFQRWPWMTRAITLAPCFLIPSVDEGIQRFSAGRSCQLSDMLIDMTGLFCGMIVMRRIRRQTPPHRQDKEE